MPYITIPLTILLISPYISFGSKSISKLLTSIIKINASYNPYNNVPRKIGCILGVSLFGIGL